MVCWPSGSQICLRPRPTPPRRPPPPRSFDGFSEVSKRVIASIACKHSQVKSFRQRSACQPTSCDILKPFARFAVLQTDCSPSPRRTQAKCSSVDLAHSLHLRAVLQLQAPHSQVRFQDSLCGRGPTAASATRWASPPPSCLPSPGRPRPTSRTSGEEA